MPTKKIRSAELARKLHESGALNLDQPVSEVLKAVEAHGIPDDALGWNVLFGDNYVLVYPVVGEPDLTQLGRLPRGPE